MEECEFYSKFPTDEECAKYLFRLRWEYEYRCPNCNLDKMYIADKCLVKCDTCNNTFPITKGTLLQYTSTKLQKCFLAIWYASTVQHPGEITAKKYQEILGTKNNRSAASIKGVIDAALTYRVKLTQLTGEVDISLIYITIRGSKLYLAIAGEVRSRKVLRFWAKLYPKEPKDIYSFVEQYVSKNSILSFPPGLMDEKHLESVGYKIKVHRSHYYCQTINNFSAAVISYLQGQKKLSDANRELYRLCASSNSAYTPISFDKLLKAIIDPQSMLPPSMRIKK